MWHAVVLAIIFEFTGAIVLGRVVTGVIAGGIANIKYFQSVPEVYAYGMIIALAVGFLWQWWASWKGLNVSATHSIIAAIMGFSLVWNGLKGVNWATPDKGAFPPYKGVVPIICSWFISPILTGFAAGMLLLILRTLILRRKNGATLALFVLPFAIFVTFFVNIFFVFTKVKNVYKRRGGRRRGMDHDFFVFVPAHPPHPTPTQQGAKKLLTSSEKDWTDAKAAWIAAACAGGIALLSAVTVVPVLHFRMRKFFDESGNTIKDSARDTVGGLSASDIEKSGAASVTPGTGGAQDVLDRLGNKMIATNIADSWQKRWWKKAVDVSTRGVTCDIHDQIEEDPIVAAIHARAEKFAPNVEFAFVYLQVFSAICVIFAHGAGEVGYMAGPLATVYEVWQTGSLPHAGGKLGNVQSPLWIVAICASGLVVGLATFGHYVMRSMGTALAKLSPTRGFCAELATSLVILIASQLSLPTSSSQCIIGAIVGVGLMEGIREGVNWKLFGAQFVSWVVTMFVCGGVTAALFAQGVYTPSKIDGAQVAAYQKGLMSMTNSTATSFNTTLCTRSRTRPRRARFLGLTRRNSTPTPRTPPRSKNSSRTGRTRPSRSRRPSSLRTCSKRTRRRWRPRRPTPSTRWGRRPCTRAPRCAMGPAWRTSRPTRGSSARRRSGEDVVCVWGGVRRGCAAFQDRRENACVFWYGAPHTRPRPPPRRPHTAPKKHTRADRQDPASSPPFLLLLSHGGFACPPPPPPPAKPRTPPHPTTNHVRVDCSTTPPLSFFLKIRAWCLLVFDIFPTNFPCKTRRVCVCA